MLFELSLIPMGPDSHSSQEIAEAVRVIESSGLPYKLTPSATCVEGEWNQVMPVLQKCHEQARKYSPHVTTFIKIEDQEGAENQLERNVTSVQQKAQAKMNA